SSMSWFASLVPRGPAYRPDGSMRCRYTGLPGEVLLLGMASIGFAAGAQSSRWGTGALAWDNRKHQSAGHRPQVLGGRDARRSQGLATSRRVARGTTNGTGALSRCPGTGTDHVQSPRPERLRRTVGGFELHRPSRYHVLTRATTHRAQALPDRHALD